MRSRKYRGHRDRPIDRPMSIEKIESRFEKQLADKQFLAEAFLLGLNKNGRGDAVPMMATK